MCLMISLGTFQFAVVAIVILDDEPKEPLDYYKVIVVVCGFCDDDHGTRTLWMGG